MESPHAHELRRLSRLLDLGFYARVDRQLRSRALTSPAPETQVQAAFDLIRGHAARAQCRWSEAEAAYAAATQALSQDSDDFATAQALHWDVLAITGKLREARAFLEGAPFVSPLARAVVHLAGGEFTQASQLLSTLEGKTSAPSHEARRFTTLWSLEAQTEVSSQTSVSKLQAFAESLAREGLFDETFHASLFWHARARLECEAAASEGFSQKSVAAVIKQAARFSARRPLYAALLQCLKATATSIIAPDAGALEFERASETLGALGAPLWQARMTAFHAKLLGARSRGATQRYVALGRNLLTQSGADDRSQALSLWGPTPQAASAPSKILSASILTQSVLGSLTSGEDDVQLQAVFEVNRAIAGTLNVDELLPRILREVTTVLKAERAVVVLKRPGGLECVAARGVAVDAVRAGSGEIPFSVFREVEKTGTVLLTDNAQLDERLRTQASVMSSEVRSILCAPLRTATEWLGFLYVDSRLKERVFLESHRELLFVFATQSATALENAASFRRLEELNRTLETRVEERTAELSSSNTALRGALEQVRNTELKLLSAQKEALEAEMNVAREIQETIVPSREVIVRPGLRMLGLVDPASQVGGDFWTWLPLRDGSTVILMGDVTGHGVGSGMVTTAAKACCDTLLDRDGVVEVGELLRSLSMVVHQAARGRMTMTAFAGRIAHDGQTLTVANAGHNAPYLLFAASPVGARPKPIMCLGKRLGDLPVEDFSTRDIALAKGDRLVVFTDGLIECTNDSGAEYSERRLQKQLTATFALPLEEQFNALVTDYKTFFGQHPRDDDVSLLALEVT